MEDFRRKRSLYQLTAAGQAAEQAIAFYEEAIGRRGQLQSVALADIAAQLRSLQVLAADRDPDPAKTHLLLLSLAERFSSLADNAQAFMSALRRAIDFSDGDVDGFLAYKERLIDYINRFIADLANSGAQIALLLGDTEAAGHERLLELAARREAADAVPEGTDAAESLASAEKQGRSTRGGTGGAGWTTGSPRATRGIRARPGCCGSCRWSAANQFTLTYPTSGFFNDDFVSTTGTAEVSSFGGFLGIPVEPSTFFTDMRNGSDVMFGPDQFGSYAGFATATDIPYSSADSFLGLRYTVGDDTFYGFARFAGPDLEVYGFETMPNIDIDANSPAVSDAGAFDLGDDGLGFVGTALLAKRRRSLQPRLTPKAARRVARALAMVAWIPACAGIQATCSPLHQRRHMRGDRARQSLEVVAAFQHRHDALVGMLARDSHELLRRPGEVGLDEVEIAERIAPVRVEAGRDDHEIGRKRLEARQDRGLHRLAKSVAAVARAQGRVDDLVVLAALAQRAGAGIMRHLMGRGVHARSDRPRKCAGCRCRDGRRNP